MAFIQFTDVSIAFGERDIVRDAHFFMKQGTHAALCGANGSGKSTFMKALAGIVQPDTGERAIEKGALISYLPQSGIVHKGRTVLEEAETAFDRIKVMEERSLALKQKLSDSKTDDADTLSALEALSEIEQAIENSGYNLRQRNITAVFTGLGFDECQMEQPCAEFSGGWQMRIALAKIILQNPDIIMLDEPTNYLDIEARTYLMKWLKSFGGAYLLVSHDRYFLDATINEVYEIFSGTLKRYAGNYSKYEAERAQEIESLMAAYSSQQAEIAKSEDLIRRFRYKASKAAMVQERIKKLEKMERIEIPPSLKKIAIRLPAPPHCGKIALTLQNISKSYGDHCVLRDLSLVLESGEKLLVAGRNGAGKTTLLSIIAGADLKHGGSVTPGAGIKIAYFTQESSEVIAGNRSIVEFLEDDCPTELIPRVRDMLGSFLFRGDDVFKSLNVLSGGEKSRLALLKLLLHPSNLLILDEPTNHLDLTTKDILLEALSQYTGTVIFVSHDRYFMDALSQKTLELRCGMESRLFYGNYSYYLDKVGVEKHDGGKPEGQKQEGQNREIEASEVQSAKDKRTLDKQQQAKIRQRKKEEESLIALIESMEQKKAALEAKLGDSEVYTDGEAVRACKAEIAECESEIESLNIRWEAL